MTSDWCDWPQRPAATQPSDVRLGSSQLTPSACVDVHVQHLAIVPPTQAYMYPCTSTCVCVSHHVKRYFGIFHQTSLAPRLEGQKPNVSTAVQLSLSVAHTKQKINSLKYTERSILVECI